MSRIFVRVADHYAHFVLDDDHEPTGRVNWVESVAEATPFETLTDCAKVVEYHHVVGYEIEIGS